MHECLEQFKHWLKCKLDDVFFTLASACVRQEVQPAWGSGFCLARLRSRCAGLVDRRCCDSAGTVKDICRTAHNSSLGLQWAATHVLTPVRGGRACPPETSCCREPPLLHSNAVRQVHANEAVSMSSYNSSTWTVWQVNSGKGSSTCGLKNKNVFHPIFFYSSSFTLLHVAFFADNWELDFYGNYHVCGNASSAG